MLTRPALFSLIFKQLMYKKMTRKKLFSIPEGEFR